MTLTREETIERLKQNKAAAEYYAGQSRITAEIENALKDSEAFDMAIEALSANAVQGEWIDVENEPYCECSVCGSYIDNLDDDYAFCPRCGARMKEGAE